MKQFNLNEACPKCKTGKLIESSRTMQTLKCDKCGSMWPTAEVKTTL